ncbi:MAG: phage holin family protein [Oscillospiraceae bacterium]
MEMLKDYVVIIVCLICWCIGYIIKNVVPTDKINKFIPLIMGALGILLNAWLNGWAFTPIILLGGLASGLASTGVNEIFKNLKPKEEK